jgi:hypothetical protein
MILLRLAQFTPRTCTHTAALSPPLAVGGLLKKASRLAASRLSRPLTGSFLTMVKVLPGRGATHILASSGRLICPPAKLVRSAALMRVEDGTSPSQMFRRLGILRLLTVLFANLQPPKTKVSVCAPILGHEHHPMSNR